MNLGDLQRDLRELSPTPRNKKIRTTKVRGAIVGGVLFNFIIQTDIRFVVLLGKWQTCISCMAVPTEILGKHVSSVENITCNVESLPTNYSPNFTSD
jgi:hypothetical protein